MIDTIGPVVSLTVTLRTMLFTFPLVSVCTYVTVQSPLTELSILALTTFDESLIVVTTVVVSFAVVPGSLNVPVRRST